MNNSNFQSCSIEMGSKDSKLPPHVLIFPLPTQGHMNSMLKLAQLLCLSHLHVTFIVSEFNHRRLLRHKNTQLSFSKYPGLMLKSISDGLPDDHPRAGHEILDIISSVIKVGGPCFREMMIENDLLASADRRPVSCIIADAVLSFTADLAEANGIRIVYFRTISAAAVWALFRTTDVVKARELPVRGNGMDELVKSIPGMEGFLRRRDLPGICRVDSEDDSALEELTALTRQTVRAQAVILNTFEDLERPILSNILNHISRLYTLGPINAHLKSRLIESRVDDPTLPSSLWAEDRSCIDWLNSMKPRSVIYVSFGSITIVTREQLLEFWHGLVNSGQKFLWVIRPDSIEGEGGDRIPGELERGTKENGYMVEWAPQDEVLNHSAIGGFLTHCGWNSTLESIAAGVPMICWPYFADQMVNSRFVSEVWKIGLDIKDTCDRIVIEDAVRQLMQVRKDEFLKKASHLAELAKEAVVEGGSSYCNLRSLIEFIESSII